MTMASSSTKPYSLSDKKRKSTPTNIWLLLGLVWLVAFLGAGCAYIDNPVKDLSMAPSNSIEDTPTISQSTQVNLQVRRSKSVSLSSKNFSPSSGTPAPLSGSPAWEDDRFDDLLTWPLHGQNGWIATRSSPHVIPDDHVGKLLEIDASSRKRISIGKAVPDQSGGYHLFEFEVMVKDATSPSLAKIEVQTLRRSGWNKKFQIYFGSSFRVSSGLRMPATTIVPHAQMGHRYHVRCGINLDSNLLDVWVDKSLMVSGLKIHPGPIVGLSISGWDLRGAVFLDNLLGSAMAPPLSVEITSPPKGTTVAGLTPIRASASKNVEWVDFYIDGVLQHSDTTRPFEYAWETAINPLPYPNHPIDFGYYFVEWKNPTDFDAARAEVNEYTNLYYASRSTYDSDLSAPEWSALLSQSLANARVEGKRIHLALEDEALWDDILDVATPYWDHISRIEIEDEPHLRRTQTEAMIQRLKSKLTARALPHRPMGFVYVYNEALPEAIHAPSLDWVGIEAYLDYPGSSDSQANIEVIGKYLSSAKAQVPDGKQIVLVMMAYDRNGNWINMDTLRDLQIPVYMQAFDDPRVVAITMFSYTRQGGSRDHPELRTPHRLIGERILGVSIPGSGNGPRTLTVQAGRSFGDSTTDRVTVTVQNPLAPSPIPSPSSTPTPTPMLPPSRDGLIVRGFVNETPSVQLGGGPGLLGAKIYLQLDSNMEQVIAMTDRDGYFESDFIPILGDEKVRVWAEKRGYSITPDQCSWDHPAGFEERDLYFRAEKLASPTPIPTRPSEPGLTIRGYVTRRLSVNFGGGPGLSGVKIYVQLGFGTGRLVAITDQDGHYQSEFIYIPGTETVQVWAEKDGFTCSPEVQSWLHYPGYEARELYFEARLLDDPTPTPTPTDYPESGLRIYGRVTKSPSLTFGGGSGVAGVKIYTQVGYGNRRLVAETNQDGYYQSDFIYIPISEMVSVWAIKEGYTFSPERYTWLHITPYEEYHFNFEVQSITTPTPTPWLTPTATPWLTPTPAGSSVPPPVPDLWEDDSFDLLSTGSLHGQNGWVKGQASAMVISVEGGEKILEINSDPNTTINMNKIVPRQDGGTHRFEFDVMVTGATEPSLAKIEIRTYANAGWDKKFQLYFGSSMRVNYNPSGAAINFVSTTQMGHWYHIRCDMNLDSGKANIWVDGANVVSGIPMHPGPIVGLSISGWDRTGAVYLDNLLGSR